MGLAAVAGLFLSVSTCRADVFNTTLYYTNFNGGENVNQVDFTYDSTTGKLTKGLQKGIAALAGADGIIFDGAGHLLVGGQGANVVFQLNPDGTNIKSASAGGFNSYHLALSPDGKTAYTSTFKGPLVTLPTNPISAGTAHAVTGGDTGVTQIAFAPGTGKVFYSNSNPNGFGNYGTIDLSTFKTTQLGANVRAVHGIIYDPFTGLITFFGAGAVATIDQNGGSFKTSAQLLAGLDFDQGAVDGFGHAYIAGSNGITFLDYSTSHDITNPDRIIFTGGFGSIDDLAPLTGLGSNGGAVPEPSSMVLLVTGGLGYAAFRIRRRKNAVA
jgi:hypothetical protein